MLFITVIKKYNLFLHLHFIFQHMNVVCPGIKQIHTIYQHFVTLVCFPHTQFTFVFTFTIFITAHERILAGY